MISRNADYSIQRLRGLSTDTKPTDTPNGSEFREMDTGKDFMYDAASGAWKEQPTSGASGGGGSAVFVVTKSNGALDKTFAEIKSALDSGSVVMLHYLEYGADKVKYLTDVYGSGTSYTVTFTHEEDEEFSSYTYLATSENGTLEPFNH